MERAGTPPLVLASASPRRRDLLGRLGLPFMVVPSGLDESADPTLPPAVLVERLARAKAAVVATGRQRGIVIGSDTVVVLDGEPIGKPTDAAEAATTLRRLRARAHLVLTGLAVIALDQERVLASVVTSTVQMADYDEPTIAAYVATGEPFDKAGSYAAQGRGAGLIAAITGCYTNVVGLPLCDLASLLRQLDLTLPIVGPPCTDQAGRPCVRLR